MAAAAAAAVDVDVRQLMQVPRSQLRRRSLLGTTQLWVHH
jgi:hypothetical protein